MFDVDIPGSERIFMGMEATMDELVKCETCGSHSHDADAHTRCPFCGKRKRGWRTEDAHLCAACERAKVGE